MFERWLQRAIAKEQEWKEAGAPGIAKVHRSRQIYWQAEVDRCTCTCQKARRA